MLELVILVYFTAINLTACSVVVARNYRDRTNLVFSGFIIGGVAWAGLNYMSNHGSYATKLIGNRGAFTAGLLATVIFWYFSLLFPRTRKLPKLQKLFISLAPGLLIASLTNLVVKSFHDQPEKAVTGIVPGPLYGPFILYLAAIFGLAVVNFRHSSKKVIGIEKQRIELIYVGIGTTFIWGFVLSALYPFLTGKWWTTKFGPFGLIFLTGAVYYSLTRHRLFDVRAVIIRSLGFITARLLFSSVFVALILLFGIKIIELELSASSLALLIGSGIFASLSLPYALKLFTRLTDNIFYADRYEIQNIVNNLSHELVGNLSIDSIAKRSLNTINVAIRARSANLLIKDKITGRFNQYNEGRLLGLSDELIAEIERSPNNLNMTDSDNQSTALAKHMAKAGVYVSIRLVGGKDNLGYIILSEKLNGRLYNSQDIKLLAIASNEIALALENARQYEEIAKFNKTLSSKVEGATRELRHSNQKLKAMDETKDEFISMASHQLRTPLTSVKGYISMVLDGDVGHISPPQRKMLEQAFTSSQRMVYLISDLLNVSRLQTGKFVIEPVGSHLDQVVADEVNQLKESAKIHNLELIYDRPSDFPIVYIDETKIRQVMMNFMDNAIYYTPAYGKVWVSLRASESSIEFTVKDTGMGVPKAQRHQLFTKFFRADNARTARPDGTGLGLFMAKKVVVAQGGAIIFESEEGKGSTFGFSFPLSALVMSTKNT